MADGPKLQPTNTARNSHYSGSGVTRYSSPQVVNGSIVTAPLTKTGETEVDEPKDVTDISGELVQDQAARTHTLALRDNYRSIETYDSEAGPDGKVSTTALTDLTAGEGSDNEQVRNTVTARQNALRSRLEQQYPNDPSRVDSELQRSLEASRYFNTREGGRILSALETSTSLGGGDGDSILGGGDYDEINRILNDRQDQALQEAYAYDESTSTAQTSPQAFTQQLQVRGQAQQQARSDFQTSVGLLEGQDASALSRNKFWGVVGESGLGESLPPGDGNFQERYNSLSEEERADFRTAVFDWTKNNALAAHIGEAKGARTWAEQNAANPAAMAVSQSARRVLETSDQMLALATPKDRSSAIDPGRAGDALNITAGGIPQLVGDLSNVRRPGAENNPYGQNYAGTAQAGTWGEGDSSDSTLIGMLGNIGVPDELANDPDFLQMVAEVNGLSSPDLIQAGGDLVLPAGRPVENDLLVALPPVQAPTEPNSAQLAPNENPQGQPPENEEEESYDPTEDAGKLYEAMYGGIFGMGTDEEAILTALDGKSAEEIQSLKDNYSDHYGRDLVNDLRGDLSGPEFDLVSELLEGEKNGDDSQGYDAGVDVARLHDAVAGLGTKEDVIFSTLEGKSQDELEAISALYEEQYGEALDHSLSGDLSGKDLERANSLLARGQTSDAEKLHYAMDGMGTDEGAIFSVLEGKNEEQRREILEDYKNRYGEDLSAGLESELSGKDLERANSLLQSGQTSDAERLHYAMDGMGTDESTIFSVLEGKNEDERRHILEDYKNRYGEDLSAGLESDLSGKDLERANSLLARGQTSDAEKLHYAMDGMGTDEGAVFSVLEGKNDEQRREILEDYKNRYGEDLSAGLASELSGKDLDRANSLLENGETSEAEQLRYAMEGMGTDEEAIMRLLEGKSDEEIASLRTAYRNETGDDLDAALESELGGQELFDARQALKGKPESIDEAVQRSNEEYSFQREGGSNAISSFAMDLVNDKGDTLDTNNQRVNDQYDAYQRALAEGRTADAAAAKDRLSQLLGYTDIDADSYEDSKDAVAETASSVAATAAGAVVIAASGGTATPLVLAAAAAAGAATKVGTSAAITGSGYDSQDIAVDAGMGALDAGSVVAGAVPGRAAAAAFEAGTVAGPGNRLVAQVIEHSVGGLTEGALASGGTEALRSETWKNGIAGGLQNIALATGMDAAISTVTGGTISAAGDGISALKRGLAGNDLANAGPPAQLVVRGDGPAPGAYAVAGSEDTALVPSADTFNERQFTAPSPAENPTTPIQLPTNAEGEEFVAFARQGGIPENDLRKWDEWFGASRIEASPYLADIPEHELLALYGYTGSGFRTLNAALRNGDPSELARLEPYLNSIEAGLQRMPTFEGTVYRGINAADPEGMAARYIEALESGQPLVRPTFTSTSAVKPADKYADRNFQFVIDSKSGRQIQDISYFGREENEVLFPPQASFNVQSVELVNGRYVVRMNDVSTPRPGHDLTSLPGVENRPSTLIQSRLDNVSQAVDSLEEVQQAAPAPSPARRALSEEELGVQERAISALNDDFEGFIAEYERRFGNTLDLDDARELFAEYSASPETRARYASAIHKPSGMLMDEMLERRLATPVEPGTHPQTVFTAGGAGAGKSSARGLSGIFEDAEFVFDSTMADAKWSREIVQDVMDTGRDVNVTYVYRDPFEAFVNGVLPRAAETGRIVPVEVFAGLHQRVRQSMEELAEHFDGDPRFSFDVVSNTRGPGQAFHSTLEELPHPEFDNLTETLYTYLDEAYKQGEIPQHVYDAFQGARP